MNVIRSNLVSSLESFWDAVKIYYDHPNSINKQVLFSEAVFGAELETPITEVDCQTLFSDLCGKLMQRYDLHYGMKSQQYMKFNVIEVAHLNKNIFEYFNKTLLVRKLIPKLYDDNNTQFYEFFFLDKINATVYIFTAHTESEKVTKIVTPSARHRSDPFIILKFKNIKLTFDEKFLELFYDNELNEKGINWLKAIFLKKFMKLMLSKSKNIKDKVKPSNKFIFTNQVDIVQYYQLNEKMKSKYAKILIENWTENTDPKKFVYEDIGIATYLMMLWNGGQTPDKDSKKQSFVDLGCGNGLLVHILNSEGHMGVGLDIRKRKIWDTYHPTTVLKEETIIPTVNMTYPKADWLIGNHSDELTAWIPIMARRSNSHCQYFVLPCCPFQLNGKKFQRKNSSLSSYQDFLCYVKSISEMCDFDTYVDKLKIPSTKRICLVGKNKPGLSDEKVNAINEILANYVKQECQAADFCDDEYKSETKKGRKDFKSDKTLLDFKVRESVESVRNCTKLPQELIDEILVSVMNLLLRETVTCNVVKDNKSYLWNRGGKLPISELAENVKKELLKQLKEECKGLQTLLKNHHFLFEVCHGHVQFRSPESMLQISKKFFNAGHNSKWKKRKCWFFYNHPDKCPLSNDECSYSHDT